MLRRLALVLLLAAGCAHEAASSGLEARLAAAVEAAGQAKQPLELASTTDFAWDRVYVFAPYTPTSAIQKDLGFAWPEAARTNIDAQDGISLLVFVKGRRVVKALSYPRNLGDWAMIENHSGFTPAQAVFSVTAEQADPAWWVVSETKPSR